MDLGRIRELIDLAEERNLVELEVRTGDETIRFVRAGTPAGMSGRMLEEATLQPGPTMVATVDAPNAGMLVSAPMAGTFYAGPAPGAAPFVQIGARVALGDVLCIIESMKMLNEIRAGQDGVVVAITCADAQPVGTGDPLFRIA